MSTSNYVVAQSELDHLVAAPGDCITSTAPGGGYGIKLGTSMASARVSGSVALCIGDGAPGRCAGKSPSQIIGQVRSDAAARSTSASCYGFAGDSSTASNGRHYGDLVWTAVAAPATATTSTTSTSTTTTTVAPTTTTTAVPTSTTTVAPTTTTTPPAASPRRPSASSCSSCGRGSSG